MTFDIDAAQKRQLKKARRANALRKGHMADVLKTDAGRKVIWELMELGGLMSRVSSTDTELTQRMLGRRDLALDIHDWVMQANPQAFMNMLQLRADSLEEQEENEDD